MTAILAPPIVFQGLGFGGLPLPGGRLFSYVAGTSIPQATWTDSTQLEQNLNPVILNANGQAAVWLDPTLTYKFILQDQFGNQVGVAADQVQGSLTEAALILILTQAFIGAILYPQTAAENSAGVTPSNFAYPPGNPWRYGADGTGGANDIAALATSSTILATTGVNGWRNGAPIGGFLRTAAEISASVLPTNYSYQTQPYDIRRYGALLNGINDDTGALNQAISVASQFFPTGPSIGGSAVSVPWGYSILSSEVTLPNRARVLGNNKRGSYFQASASWNSGGSPWMFHAVNGTSSMFDSTLENLTVDANGIAGLGCILSDAWQDDCGLRGVLLIGFTTSAIKFQNGYGGADQCKIVDTEIFGGSVTNSIGIDLTSPIGLIGGFCLDVQNSVIAGAPNVLSAGISCSGNSLRCTDVEFEGCTAAIIVDGTGFVTLTDVRGSSSSVTTLVQINSTFTGTLRMINCRRAGATNFINDLRAGGYGAITGTDYPEFIIKANDSTESAKGLAYASAWAYWNGTTTGTNPPGAGFNVSTITRNSAGNYTVTMLRPMLSANGAAAPSCNLNNAFMAFNLISATTFSVIITVSGTPTDSNQVGVIVFGG